MIELLKVKMSGFGVFLEETSLRLDQRGLVLVTGENRDSSAATSNGAGKTTIFKAISWGLYGKTIDGLTTQIAHKAAKSALVEIRFEAGGTKYLVRRSRDKRSGALSFLIRAGGKWEDQSQTKAADTQAAIESVLGLDFDAFRSCCLFGQGDTTRFASPSVGDAQRKAVLGRILGLDVYERARTEARKRAGELATEIEDRQAELRAIEREVVKIDTDLARHDGQRAGLQELATVGIDAVYALRGDVDAASAAVREAEKAIEIHEAKLVKAVAAHEETAALLERARELYTNRSRAAAIAVHDAACLKDPGPCPTCGADRDKPDPERFAEATKAADKARARAHKADATVKALQLEYNTDTNAEGAARRALNEETGRARRARAKVRECEAELSAKEIALSEVEARLETLDDETEALKRQRLVKTTAGGQTEHEIEAARNRASRVAWWVKALGPKGVPAFAIEAVLPVLNAKTNQHLLSLADGDITVEWSPTAPKSGGGVKEELTLGLVVEGVEGAKPSGGQQRKVELATELALAEIVRAREGTGTNALFLDEAFEGLDGEGANRVCDWLDGLDFESIFVVSHTDEVEESFDALLTVVKSGSAATLSEEI